MRQDQPSVFGVTDRERRLASVMADRRVVAGAVVGSLTFDEGDRWSDVALTFGVADGFAVSDMLADWTRDLSRDLGAVTSSTWPSAPPGTSRPRFDYFASGLIHALL